MKKNAKKICGIVLAVCLIIGFIYVQFDSLISYANVVEANWNIRLPFECEDVYGVDEGPSFHGDGFRYNVLGCDEAVKMSEVEVLPISTMPEGYKYKIKEIVETLKVPQEHLPQDIETFYYENKDGSDELFILIDSDKTKIYVVESFI